MTDRPGRDLKSDEVVRPRLAVGEALQHAENTFPNEKNKAGTMLEAIDRCGYVAQGESLAGDGRRRDAGGNDERAEESDSGEFSLGDPADFELSSERVHHGMVGREKRRHDLALKWCQIVGHVRTLQHAVVTQRAGMSPGRGH
jgi:hypothetical protein